MSAAGVAYIYRIATTSHSHNILASVVMRDPHTYNIPTAPNCIINNYKALYYNTMHLLPGCIYIYFLVRSHGILYNPAPCSCLLHNYYACMINIVGLCVRIIIVALLYCKYSMTVWDMYRPIYIM